METENRKRADWPLCPDFGTGHCRTYPQRHGSGKPGTERHTMCSDCKGGWDAEPEPDFDAQLEEEKLDAPTVKHGSVTEWLSAELSTERKDLISITLTDDTQFYLT